MTTDYPRITPDGRTVWACCESSIGPVCGHRTPPPPSLDETLALDGAPVTIDDAGNLTVNHGLHAPECYVMTDTEGQCVGEPHVSSDWELLSGWTGQHGYNGAIMHASEYIGGALAEHIAETPGTYVAVTVSCLAPTEADDDDTPAGWAVARYVGTGAV
ncbi:hypothetical protein Mbo2_097 [Rhodococcus phage Mbo2]|uniref:Uncharacterized protein n=1 Tax=Rhodococcus phage Mbo2 TaxID=2936911 RepID=A0A9E7ISG4_9CAUD|nr:hypothetical protein Mbo2_097 [Rhodococcus phage Mbo2]